MSQLADVDQVSTTSDPPVTTEDGSLLRGFVWAAVVGIVFWIVLARLLLR